MRMEGNKGKKELMKEGRMKRRKEGGNWRYSIIVPPRIYFEG
jgi:hypothetical protein